MSGLRPVGLFETVGKFYFPTGEPYRIAAMRESDNNIVGTGFPLPPPSFFARHASMALLQRIGTTRIVLVESAIQFFVVGYKLFPVSATKVYIKVMIILFDTGGDIDV